MSAAGQQDAAPHAGVVVRIDGAQATVRFTRGKLCAHCGACISVGETELELSVTNTLGAAVGDRVEVSLAPKRIVQASLLAYAIPLALLLLGVWLGSLHSDTAALACGLIGCAGGYLALRLLEKRGGMRREFLPEMTAILNPEEALRPGESTTRGARSD